MTTAHKETIEEAGIKINLLGVLAVQSSLVKKKGGKKPLAFFLPKRDQGKHGGRQRVIFYAEPSDLKFGAFCCVCGFFV